MTRISTNRDESTSSCTVCIINFYPWPSTMWYIEYLINGIFNNIVKHYVFVWHSNPTTTTVLLLARWYNFFRNHAGAYFLGHHVDSVMEEIMNLDALFILPLLLLLVLVVVMVMMMVMIGLTSATVVDVWLEWWRQRRGQVVREVESIDTGSQQSRYARLRLWRTVQTRIFCNNQIHVTLSSVR